MINKIFNQVSTGAMILFTVLGYGPCNLLETNDFVRRIKHEGLPSPRKLVPSTATWPEIGILKSRNF